MAGLGWSASRLRFSFFLTGLVEFFSLLLLSLLGIPKGSVMRSTFATFRYVRWPGFLLARRATAALPLSGHGHLHVSGAPDSSGTRPEHLGVVDNEPHSANVAMPFSCHIEVYSAARRAHGNRENSAVSQ